MRRSWFVGIVVPALLAIGFSSGCATNQKRLASTPAPQFEEVQPVESGRRLFGWGWWSKPKASTSPMMADQSFVSESPVLAPESHAETTSVDPWPTHKPDRLSKFFPSFNRKTTTPQPGPTPVLGEPTASRAANALDRGVRQAGADSNETSDPKNSTPGRRQTDDPPLLSSPIQVPSPGQNRPESASKDSVDLGVAGANDSINQSAKVDFQAKDRRYSVSGDPPERAGRLAAQAEGRGGAACPDRHEREGSAHAVASVHGTPVHPLEYRRGRGLREPERVAHGTGLLRDRAPEAESGCPQGRTEADQAG